MQHANIILNRITNNNRYLDYGQYCDIQIPVPTNWGTGTFNLLCGTQVPYLDANIIQPFKDVFISKTLCYAPHGNDVTCFERFSIRLNRQDVVFMIKEINVAGDRYIVNLLGVSAVFNTLSYPHNRQMTLRNVFQILIMHLLHSPDTQLTDGFRNLLTDKLTWMEQMNITIGDCGPLLCSPTELSDLQSFVMDGNRYPAIAEKTANRYVLSQISVSESCALDVNRFNTQSTLDPLIDVSLPGSVEKIDLPLPPDNIMKSFVKKILVLPITDLDLEFTIDTINRVLCDFKLNTPLIDRYAFFRQHVHIQDGQIRHLKSIINHSSFMHSVLENPLYPGPFIGIRVIKTFNEEIYIKIDQYEYYIDIIGLGLTTYSVFESQ